MSKGGNEKTTTQTTSVDPDIKAAYLQNVDYARAVANQLPAQQFAGFNPQYQAGEQLVTGAGTGEGAMNLGTAADITRAAGGYSPLAVGADQGLIQQYMNPYTQEVIDTGLSDLERARQGALQQVGQQATAAKAFGGSRHGVAEAAMSGEYGRQAGNLIANLRSQGYTQALNAAQQAQLANQAADLSGAQYRLGAANQLGMLGGQQTAQQYAAGQALMGLGGARQQLAQQQMDAERNLNLQRLQVMQSALGLQMPNMGGTVTSSTPTYSNPALGALGGAALGSQVAGLGPYGWAIGGGLGLLSSL